MEKGATENKAAIRQPKKYNFEAVYRYKGGGTIPNIPARDFTELEAQSLGILDVIKNSPLWAKDGD